jgi:hypothetical protein
MGLNVTILLFFFFYFYIVRYSRDKKTRCFGNWICFRPQVKGEKTETDPDSETSCFLVSRIPDDRKVKKNSNSVCYTPSSEPFRMSLYMYINSYSCLSIYIYVCVCTYIYSLLTCIGAYTNKYTAGSERKV